MLCKLATGCPPAAVGCALAQHQHEMTNTPARAQAKAENSAASVVLTELCADEQLMARPGKLVLWLQVAQT